MTILRFHTPLIEPDRRISRIRLSDKACVMAIFPLRRQRRLVHGGAGRVSGVSQPVICLEGSNGFVTSNAAPIATGWSDPVAR